MSESCPRFDEERVKNRLQGFFDATLPYMGNILKCDIKGGKKNRKMIGGVIINRNHVINALYVLLAVTVAIASTGETAMYNFKGVIMLFSGKCSYIQNRLWDLVYLGHPICTKYNELSFKIIKILWDRNPKEFAELVGSLLLVVATPWFLKKQLVKAATTALKQLSTRLPRGLVDPSTPPSPGEPLQLKMPSSEEESESEEEEEGEGEGEGKGGARRSRRRIRKTGRKLTGRKSKKSRKTRSKRRTRRR
jgi:hypothetical protein